MSLRRFIQARRKEAKKIVFKLRDPFARIRQNRAVREMGLSGKTDLILFFVPSINECCGGLMSIASLAAESRRLNPQATVLCATLPGEKTLFKNETFPNDELIIRFSLVCRLTHPKTLIIHLPEVFAGDFCGMLSAAQRAWLKRIPDLHINILNQNIAAMPPRETWQDLFILTSHVTQTTAHDRYATQEVCDRFQIPLHHFSVHIDHSKWPRRTFDQREKLIVISPDANENRKRVLSLIRCNLPDYQIREVRNMKFTDYLGLIARARVAITFGEGMDGYFADIIQTGGVGVAVYNDKFFPSLKWAALDNVYFSYEDLLSKLVTDIRRMEKDRDWYESMRSRVLGLVSELYGVARFSDNLRRFYAGQYDFWPQRAQIEK